MRLSPQAQAPMAPHWSAAGRSGRAAKNSGARPGQAVGPVRLDVAVVGRRQAVAPGNDHLHRPTAGVHSPLFSKARWSARRSSGRSAASVRPANARVAMESHGCRKIQAEENGNGPHAAAFGRSSSRSIRGPCFLAGEQHAHQLPHGPAIQGVGHARVTNFSPAGRPRRLAVHIRSRNSRRISGRRVIAPRGEHRSPAGRRPTAAGRGACRAESCSRRSSPAAVPPPPLPTPQDRTTRANSLQKGSASLDFTARRRTRQPSGRPA